MAKRTKLLALVVASAMLLTMLPVMGFASGVTIELATAVVDAENEDLVTVTIPYNAVGLDQVTFLATIGQQDVQTDGNGNVTNGAYIDQVPGGAGSFVFKVDRSSQAMIDAGGKMYIKVGGTDINPITGNGGNAGTPVQIPMKAAILDAPALAFAGADVDDGDQLSITISSQDAGFDYAGYMAAAQTITIGSVTLRVADNDFAWLSNTATLSEAGIAKVRAILANEDTLPAQLDVTIAAAGYRDATGTWTLTASDITLIKEIEQLFNGVAGAEGSYTASGRIGETATVTEDSKIFTIPADATLTLVVTDAEGTVIAPEEGTNNYVISRPEEGESASKVTFTYTYNNGTRTATVVVTGTVPAKGAAGPEVDAAASKVYTQKNPLGFEGFVRVFIKLNDGNGEWVATHSDDESVVAYSAERAGYDCLISTSATTLEDILAEITWEQGTPSVTIANYGDSDGNGKLNALDMAYIKRVGLGTAEPTAVLAITMDTDGNNVLNAIDMANLKRIGLGTLDKLPIIN